MELSERYLILMENGHPTSGFSQIEDCKRVIADELEIGYESLEAHEVGRRFKITTYGSFQANGLYRQIVNGEEYNRRKAQFL
jgi:hypothetical protein